MVLWITTTRGEVTGSVDLIQGLTDRQAQEQSVGHVDVYGDTMLLVMPVV